MISDGSEAEVDRAYIFAASCCSCKYQLNYTSNSLMPEQKTGGCDLATTLTLKKIHSILNCSLVIIIAKHDVFHTIDVIFVLLQEDKSALIGKSLSFRVTESRYGWFGKNLGYSLECFSISFTFLQICCDHLSNLGW